MKLGPQHTRLAICALIRRCDDWNQAVRVLDIIAYIVRSLLHDGGAVAVHGCFHLNMQAYCLLPALVTQM